MKLELTEALWLEQYGSLTLVELAEHSGLPTTEVSELVELGVFEPLEKRPGEDPLFAAECLVTARVACRLREDFELDPHGVAVVLELLDRVHELEAEVQALRATLPRARRG